MSASISIHNPNSFGIDHQVTDSEALSKSWTNAVFTINADGASVTVYCELGDLDKIEDAIRAYRAAGHTQNPLRWQESF